MSATRRGSNSSTASKKSSEIVLCGTCHKETKERSKSIECCLCNRWFHATCQNISDDVYKTLCTDSNSDAPQLSWYCNSSCSSWAKKFITQVMRIDAEVQQLKTTVADIDTRVTNIESGQLTDQMIGAVKNVQMEMQAEVGPSMQHDEVQEIIETKTRECLEEVEDRARRQTNLIVFKMPEGKERSEEENRIEDELKIKQLLHAVKAKFEPVEIYRLKNNPGRKKQRGGDATPISRPIRVVFHSKYARDDALSAYIRAHGNLEDEDEDETSNLIRNVNVRKDLTVEERRLEEILVNEMKEKRKESKDKGDLNAKWVIRFGKIRNIGKYPRQRTAHSSDPSQGEMRAQQGGGE